MAGARHFSELVCWSLSRQLKVELYALVELPVVAADRRFVDQVRDAAASAPRNIAEGFGRRTDADFAHFLDIARASLNECQAHLGDAVDRRYLDQAKYRQLIALNRRAVGAVAGLQRHLRRKKRKKGRTGKKADGQ